MKTTPPSAGQRTSPYGMRNGSFHPGIDYSAGKGAPVVAFADGVVVTATAGCTEGVQSCNGGAGNFITIDHQNGYFTRYLHLDSLAVKQGQTVQVGQKIGTEGNTGYSFGSHLHFEIRTDANYGEKGSLDPEPFVKGLTAFPDKKKVGT